MTGYTRVFLVHFLMIVWVTEYLRAKTLYKEKARWQWIFKNAESICMA